MSADPQRGAFGKSAIEMPEHALQAAFVDQWPHFGVRQQWICGKPLR